MKPPSTKPYLIRSIYEWCSECGYTPLLSVKANHEMDIPTDFIKNGEIIFNIHPDAVHNLVIGNDIISFSARFDGIAKEIVFHTEAVSGIFAREVNQGISFPETQLDKEQIQPETESDDKADNKSSQSNTTKHNKKDKVKLRLIK